VIFMGVQGPLARSAADLELGFDVVAGPDEMEDIAWRLELPPARADRIDGLRVAVMPSLSWLPVDGEIAATLDRLASDLGRLGATVKQASPEPLGDFSTAHALYLRILEAVMTSRAPAEVREAQVATHRALGTAFDIAMAEGLEARASDYFVWFRQRADVRAAWRAFFKDWDVVLAPAFFTPAFEHIECAWPPGLPAEDTMIDVNGSPVRYGLGLGYPALATLPGLPATAFPVGLTASGLPIGLQAVGPYLEDRTTIRFAALVEEAFGGFRRPPGYDAD
jgi:amidase